MNESNNIKKMENEEASEIYKIFEEIYSKAPPILKDLSNNNIDYKESMLEKIDFKKIDTKFKNGEYCSITDTIKDIRVVFLNCYSFYGVKSDHTKKSLELEELLEKKISFLDKKYKLMADVNLTFNLLNMKGKPSSKLRYPKDCYDSVLLRSVAHCRPERLRKHHKILSTTLITDEDNAHILKKILSWENEVYFNVFHQYISSMWELPEIGHFVAILFKKLNLDIISQGEIERMFLMPKESTTMGKIMTTLLMPVKKKKFIGQIMPYKVWSEKLSKKVSDWYKVYYAKKQNKVIVMNLLGIHPDFWVVMNEKNPLIEKDYSELSYIIKVWLVKGLCDYVTVKFKTINHILTNCNERQCTIWKNDLETEEYFFFDSMPDLRIYYYTIPYDEPSFEFLESVKTDKEVVNVEDNLPIKGFSEGFRTTENKKHFKLIADSVEGLRSFLYKLDMEGTSVPEDLKSALENFIVKIEPEEYNLIALNNDSKVKLFKDCVSYADRIQKDKDNISLWEEKDSKLIAQTKNEEIIVGKRQRKLIVQQDFDMIKFYESDEYVSESERSQSDFTDSEDEWGAMNQPKNKVKQSPKTSSKLLKLKKPLSKEGKILNHDTTNLLDTNQNYEFKGHNKTLVCSKNKDNIPLLLEEKDLEPIAQDENKEIIVGKRQRKLIVQQDFDMIKFYKSDEYVSENERSQSDFTDSGDEWGAMNQSKNKVKQPPKTFSKLLELEKQLREEDKISKHSTNKVFGINKKDKSIKSVKILKTQNEVKCSNNINTFVNGHSKNIDNVYNYEEIVIINVDKEENESFDGLKQVEIINLDEDMQNGCEILNDNFETPISTCIENKIKKTNELIESANLIKDDGKIIISDDEDNVQIIISDDEDDFQTVPMSVKPKNSSLKINKPYSLKTNLNKPRNSVSANKQTMPTNFIKPQATSSIIHKLSQNVTILPANVHIPKGIEVSMVKTPQTKINSHFNSIKMRSNLSNGHLPNDPLTVNVKCEIISKQNLNGEVKFYVRLPNGEEHPGPNELINQYLKQHKNQLPDYWLVPLPVEVAKQYGFN